MFWPIMFVMVLAASNYINAWFLLVAGNYWWSLASGIVAFFAVIAGTHALEDD